VKINSAMGKTMAAINSTSTLTRATIPADNQIEPIRVPKAV